MTSNLDLKGRIVTGSLCYVVDAERVLLLKRRNPPEIGLWSAPGGKMELGESPQQCVIREIREETGLTITNPLLRGIVTVYDTSWPIHWLLFIFRADEFSGELLQTDEGELAWIPIHQFAEYPMPYSDGLFIRRAISLENSFFQARFVYEAESRCIEELFY